jgi:LmbE family N-acetylglucosaminyl deacetylase
VLKIPDGALDERDPRQLAALVRLIRAARPRLLFAPHRVDRHPDHEATGRLARRATFFAGLHRFPGDLRPHRPRALVHYIAGFPAEPTFLVDVSPYMAARRAGIRAYASQFIAEGEERSTVINAPGYLQANEARLAGWGARIGVRFAEGFVLEQTPRVDDIVAWLDPPREEGS